MRVLGMLSGTSHDGIDVAVVEFSEAHGDDGGVLRARLLEHGSVPYSPALRADLVAALPPGRPGFEQVCALDVRIGQEFAAAAAAVGEEFDLVCSHGQTVFHWVQDGAVLGTLQLGQPSWTAEATGRPVVSDLRTADVAAGGQGAPLVPLLDRLLLAPLVERGLTAAALNLGGIANVTVCAPDGSVRAWDTGPANALLDAAAGGVDVDGRLAAAGTVDDDLLAALLTEPFYAQPPPKTTGKELFHPGYVAEFLGGRVLPQTDLVATLAELTVRTVADALTGVDVVVASGGGVRNPVLVAGLRRELGDRLLLSDDVGCPAGEKEAVAFALLGYAFATGRPGNVPSCTGARGPRLLGRLTPGRTGLPAPFVHAFVHAPAAPWPSALHLG